MSVTFGLPVSVRFPSDPWFIRRNPCFLRRYFFSVFLFSGNLRGWVSIYCLHSWPWRACVWFANRGGGGSCWWQKILRRCARKIVMVRNLLRQTKARSWVPVRILVLQGTGEEISVDHAGVQPRNFDFDPAVNPDAHVQNGFVHFCCHELTQNLKYNQGLLSKHTINRKNKQRKLFPLLEAFLIVLILILVLPTSQELIYCLMHIYVRI